MTETAFERLERERPDMIFVCSQCGCKIATAEKIPEDKVCDWCLYPDEKQTTLK